VESIFLFYQCFDDCQPFRCIREGDPISVLLNSLSVEKAGVSRSGSSAARIPAAMSAADLQPLD
jgi:hypothetical protein